MRKIIYLLMLLPVGLVSGCCGFDDGYYGDYTPSPLVVMLGDSTAKISEIVYESPINHRQEINSRSFSLKETELYDKFNVIIMSDLGHDTISFRKEVNTFYISECDAYKSQPVFNFSAHTFDSAKFGYSGSTYNQRRTLFLY